MNLAAFVFALLSGVMALILIGFLVQRSKNSTKNSDSASSSVESKNAESTGLKDKEAAITGLKDKNAKSTELKGEIPRLRKENAESTGLKDKNAKGAELNGEIAGLKKENAEISIVNQETAEIFTVQEETAKFASVKEEIEEIASVKEIIGEIGIVKQENVEIKKLKNNNECKQKHQPLVSEIKTSLLNGTISTEYGNEFHQAYRYLYYFTDVSTLLEHMHGILRSIQEFSPEKKTTDETIKVAYEYLGKTMHTYKKYFDSAIKKIEEHYHRSAQILDSLYHLIKKYQEMFIENKAMQAAIYNQNIEYYQSQEIDFFNFIVKEKFHKVNKKIGCSTYEEIMEMLDCHESSEKVGFSECLFLIMNTVEKVKKRSDDTNKSRCDKILKNIKKMLENYVSILVKLSIDDKCDHYRSILCHLNIFRENPILEMDSYFKGNEIQSDYLKGKKKFSMEKILERSNFPNKEEVKNAKMDFKNIFLEIVELIRIPVQDKNVNDNDINIDIDEIRKMYGYLCEANTIILLLNMAEYELDLQDGYNNKKF